MKWFRNLNATPRLMLSFGVVLLLLMGISLLGISNLSSTNDRLANLYKQDMQGALVADRLEKSFLKIGKRSRDVVLHIGDPRVVAADESMVFAEFDTLHASLSEAKQLFYTKQGLAYLDNISALLPEWEALDRDALKRAEANNLPEAKLAIDQTGAAGDREKPFAIIRLRAAPHNMAQAGAASAASSQASFEEF